MSEWFQAKVEFLRQIDNGLIKKITEQYLVDSMSFTECEARVLKEQGEGVREVTCKSIARSPIKEVVMYGDTDLFHKVKVTYSLMDEETEKEKKVTTYLLVNANDVREAYERTEEHLKDMLVPFQIPKIEESPIIEVFEYQKQAPTGFVKVAGSERDAADKIIESKLGTSESSDDHHEEECAMESDAVESRVNPIFEPLLKSIYAGIDIPKDDVKPDPQVQKYDHSETPFETDKVKSAAKALMQDLNPCTDPTDGQAVAFDMPEDLIAILDEEGLNLTVGQLQRIAEQAERMSRTEFVSWLMAAHETDSRLSAEIWEVLHEG